MLECACFSLIGKSDDSFDTPWFEFGCVRTSAFVMFFETGVEIRGAADVVPGVRVLRYEYIDVC